MKNVLAFVAIALSAGVIAAPTACKDKHPSAPAAPAAKVSVQAIDISDSR
jgi:hypothetical protein